MAPSNSKQAGTATGPSSVQTVIRQSPAKPYQTKHYPTKPSKLNHTKPNHTKPNPIPNNVDIILHRYVHFTTFSGWGWVWIIPFPVCAYAAINYENGRRGGLFSRCLFAGCLFAGVPFKSYPLLGT